MCPHKPRLISSYCFILFSPHQACAARNACCFPLAFSFPVLHNSAFVCFSRCVCSPFLNAPPPLQGTGRTVGFQRGRRKGPWMCEKQVTRAALSCLKSLALLLGLWIIFKWDLFLQFPSLPTHSRPGTSLQKKPFDSHFMKYQRGKHVS